MSDLMIISPVYHRGGSGASVYYRVLVDYLVDDGLDVVVVSDSEKGSSKATYVPLFPAWASRARSFRTYISFALQNLTYFLLPVLVRKHRPRTVLVHTAFLSTAGFFPIVLRLMRRMFPTVRIVADVRDRELPTSRVSIMNNLSSSIACSTNVVNYLHKIGVEKQRVVEIPVLQEPISVTEEAIQEVLEEFGLFNSEYILFCGRIKESKRVDLLLQVFNEHIAPKRKDLKLVLAGPLKSTSSNIVNGLAQDRVIYLDNQCRKNVLALTAGAALCINLCPDEGLPRSSLEPLALGRPTLLPPNVPEFEEHCADWVVHSTDPEEISFRIERALDDGEFPVYPIENHSFASVAASYRSVLGYSD